MSDTDTGNAILPPIGQFVRDDHGLTAWKAIFDKISVDRLPDGRRHLRVTSEGELVYQRTLEAAEARHLAALLTD